MPVTAAQTAPPPKQEKPSRAHIPALDGVRAIAILAVLIAHMASIIPVTGVAKSVLNFIVDAGAFGVDLFFVLSGFLITGILLDASKGAGYFKNFYARRVLRLLPLYYAYLLLLMTLVPLVHKLAHTSMQDYSGNWWWYITYFCNWKANFAAPDPYLGHFWSLAVEEQFYLVWPTVIFLTPRRYLAWVCGALIVSALSLRSLWSYEGVYWNQIYRLTVTRWDTMAFGALAALAMRSGGWRPLAQRYAPWIALAGVGGWLGTALWQGSIDWENWTIQTYGASLAAIGFAGLILFAATPGAGPLRAFLQKPFMQSVGRYSYCIYVIHLLVFFHIEWVGLYLQKRFHLPAMVSALAILAVSLPAIYFIAALSWRYFEAPILKLKDRFV